ncbi:hypothetical protein ACF068_03620 [Streptomyces sp. NPDC016309]|uniref:hypothetical protein n=1 Tax=Streptomyces sp. NPDC016309 TaxID=3364965 RepID=UPI0036F872C9
MSRPPRPVRGLPSPPVRPVPAVRRAPLVRPVLVGLVLAAAAGCAPPSVAPAVDPIERLGRKAARQVAAPSPGAPGRGPTAGDGSVDGRHRAVRRHDRAVNWHSA